MFLNVKSMFPIRHTLIAMDHPQPDNGNTLNSDRKTGAYIVLLFHESETSQILLHEILLVRGLHKNGPPQFLFVTGNI